MSVAERIVHMILFELFAIFFMTIIAFLLGDRSLGHSTFLAVVLSSIAMAWNYFYNWGFDKVFGEDRLSRSVRMRFGHGLGFEIGITVLTFPIIMWFLQAGLWTVLLANLGVMLFFFVYAIAFNWIYDVVRGPRTSESVAG
jgi:uncharacterized membrane protein